MSVGAELASVTEMRWYVFLLKVVRIFAACS